MCRFTLYLGPSVRLSKLVTEPRHSLIHQSAHAEERAEPLNGDGFGIGWYNPRLTPEPAVFRETSPAWSNRNLLSMAPLVTSPCVLAHVRAATEGMDVDMLNCHPFDWGSYLLMHNGHIGGFRKVRRALLADLTDEAFDTIRGSTDTEHLFAVFIDEVVRHGCPVDTAGPESDGNGAMELALRLSAAIERILRTVRDHDGGENSLLNVAVADGKHAAVCRFSDDPERPPETLYYLRGELYEPAGRQFPERRKEDEGEQMVVSSERLTDDSRWKAVPPNHMLVLDRTAAPRLLPMSLEGAVQP